ncbi:MAG TPA: hypothetical protein DCY88_14295 [Cyanobacteria bacterium UBA11372]|nr:hypothetical protein [Cyanobacteria bacterium UBA11372]
MIYFPIELFLILEPWQIYSLPPIAEVRYQTDYFSEYPQQIRARTDRSAVLYRRHRGYYAVHYNEPSKVAPGAVLQLNDGAIAVFSGEPDNTIRLTSSQGTIGPIYTLQSDGSLAVPTGMVFIRFAENVDVESHREAIERAGYEIAQSLSYAPHAAWLRAQSGKISDALMGISKLEAIPNVENVEPQMLMARVLRQ